QALLLNHRTDDARRELLLFGRSPGARGRRFEQGLPVDQPIERRHIPLLDGVFHRPAELLALLVVEQRPGRGRGLGGDGRLIVRRWRDTALAAATIQYEKRCDHDGCHWCRKAHEKPLIDPSSQDLRRSSKW